MSGGSVTTIVSSNLLQPSLLAVRQATNEIFWINSGNGKVERSIFDGSERTDVWSNSRITAGAYVAMDVYKVMYTTTYSTCVLGFF